MPQGNESPNLVDQAERADQAEQIVAAIVRRLSIELDNMKELLDGFGGADMIDMISAEMNSQLTTIQGLIEDGQIFPQCNLRLSQEAPALSPCDRPLRIGIFPTAADPFHWMHLLSGLRATALNKLDKVVYVISGSDSRKPDLLRADIRHRMGKDVLRLFSPLFAYSSIALDNSLDGETNIFRILQLNPGQRVDAFYIAGTDHYYRHNPETGKLDTIQKLEDGVKGEIFGYDDTMNSISAIFLGRGEKASTRIDTFLNTESVQRMPLEASSTSIRKSLTGHGTLAKLATLPYSVLRYISSSGLYSPSIPGISRAHFGALTVGRSKAAIRRSSRVAGLLALSAGGACSPSFLVQA
jgi:nicotinic acid mononucleotide adenylyltransferase